MTAAADGAAKDALHRHGRLGGQVTQCLRKLPEVAHVATGGVDDAHDVRHVGRGQWHGEC